MVSVFFAEVERLTAGRREPWRPLPPTCPCALLLALASSGLSRDFRGSLRVGRTGTVPPKVERGQCLVRVGRAKDERGQCLVRVGRAGTVPRTFRILAPFSPGPTPVELPRPLPLLTQRREPCGLFKRNGASRAASSPVAHLSSRHYQTSQHANLPRRHHGLWQHNGRQ